MITSFLLNSSLKRISKVFSTLLNGSIISSLLAILVVSIITKKLPIESYGTIVMVQAYVMLIDQLFNFQSWQGLIKFSEESLINKNKSLLVSYIQLGIFLDIIGSVFGFVASLFLISIASKVFSFDVGIFEPYMFFSILILFRIIGTPTALLRISNKYQYFNNQLYLNWGGKFFFVLLASSLDVLTVYSTLLIFLFFEIISSLYLIYYGFKSLECLDLSIKNLYTLKPYKKYKKNRHDFLIFSLNVNLNSAILGVTRNIDELIVGNVLGPASAGAFKIMKLIGSIFSKILDPLYIAIYPEITKLVIQRKLNEIKILLKLITLITLTLSVAIFTVFYINGEFFISIIFTKEYNAYISSIHLYLTGVLFAFIFIYCQPLMLSLGFEGKAMIINLVSSIIYITILYMLLRDYDILGVAIAFLVFSITSVVPKLIILFNKLRT